MSHAYRRRGYENAQTTAELEDYGDGVEVILTVDEGAPTRIAEFSKINVYHVKMLAHLVDKLAKTQEGDGTLLDRSLVMYGSNMGNPNQHLHYDVPHVLIGGANGTLKGGRHLAYPTRAVPTGNLLVSVMEKFDIHQDTIGDSTGRLEDL